MTKPEDGMNNLTKVLEDLTRTKAEFQLRAIKAAINGDIVRVDGAGEVSFIELSDFYVSKPSR